MVTLDAGNSNEAITRSSDLLDRLTRLNTGPFAVDSQPLSAPRVRQQPTLTDPWLGDEHQPVTFPMSVPEWSLDALGYVAALVAHVCSDAGLTTSVLVSMARS